MPRPLVNALKNPGRERVDAACATSVVAVVPSAPFVTLGEADPSAVLFAEEVSGSPNSEDSRWSSESVSFEGGIVVIRSIDV